MNIINNDNIIQGGNNIPVNDIPVNNIPVNDIPVNDIPVNDIPVNDTNILQEYIKKNKQFILLIVGKPCTNKSQLAKEFSEDLNLPLINVNKYYIPNKVHETVIDGVKFNLYDHPDNIDWSLLNDTINKHKESGVIIYGNYIDLDKLTITPDFSYFVNMNNNSCKTILIKNKLLPYSSTALTNEEIMLSRNDTDDKTKAVDVVDVVDVVDDVDVVDEVEPVDDVDDVDVVEPVDNKEDSEVDNKVDNEEVGEEDDGVVEVENVEEEFADSDVIETLGAAEDADDAREQDGGDAEGTFDGNKGDSGDDKKLDVYFTSIFLPMYEELSKKIKINKFYNIKSNTTFDEIYDDMFDLLMKLIEKNVYAEKNKFKEHKPNMHNRDNWDKGYKRDKEGKVGKVDKVGKEGKGDKVGDGRYSKKDNKTAKSKKNDKGDKEDKGNKEDKEDKGNKWRYSKKDNKTSKSKKNDKTKSKIADKTNKNK